MSTSAEDALNAIEAVNTLADAMDAMKRALEHRGWSTPVSEQVGAQFGTFLFAMSGSAQSPPKRSKP